ncbi:MAG: thiamine diphosphokinase [Deltaproteobacteria bacterium]|nr:thiamine diphosphokinase [Deltaproteobacteria bacterium]
MSQPSPSKSATFSPDLIYVFLNGVFNQPVDLPPYPAESSLVVAVDGGALHCQKLGWPIHALIGDMDSLPAPTLKRIRKANSDLELFVHEAEKDQTDFELALDYLTKKYTSLGRIEVMGSLGGRWDMTIANLLLPYSERFLGTIRQSRLMKGQTLAPPIVTFRDGLWEIFLLSGPGWTVINPIPIARRVSLIPVTEKVTKVRLSGDFKYPLNEEDLFFGRTRGISNELGPNGGSVFVSGGLVIVTVSPLLEPGPVFKKPPEPLPRKGLPVCGLARKARDAKETQAPPKTLSQPTQQPRATLGRHPKA